VQSFGNLAASVIAGLLWTLASPRVAFGYLVAWMILALIGLLPAGRRPFGHREQPAGQPGCEPRRSGSGLGGG